MSAALLPTAAWADDKLEREWINLARQSERYGRFQDAERLYNEVLAENPAHQAANHRLGVMAAARGDLDLAAERFALAEQAGPPYAELLSDWGGTLYLQGDLAGAEVKLRAALALDPQHKDAQDNLSLVISKQKLLEVAQSRALEESKAAIEARAAARAIANAQLAAKARAAAEAQARAEAQAAAKAITSAHLATRAREMAQGGGSSHAASGEQLGAFKVSRPIPLKAPNSNAAGRDWYGGGNPNKPVLLENPTIPSGNSAPSLEPGWLRISDGEDAASANVAPLPAEAAPQPTTIEEVRQAGATDDSAEAIVTDPAVYYPQARYSLPQNSVPESHHQRDPEFNFPAGYAPLSEAEEGAAVAGAQDAAAHIEYPPAAFAGMPETRRAFQWPETLTPGGLWNKVEQGMESLQGRQANSASRGESRISRPRSAFQKFPTRQY